MKRVLLAILVVCYFIPLWANESGSCGENVTYAFDQATGTLTISGTGAMNDYGFNNQPWYSFCEKIKNVIIEDGVTSIGNYAFADDYGNITSVSIGNSVTSIGEMAFYCCGGLTVMDFPNSLTSIGQSAFQSCNGLTSLNIPNSVSSIGRYAFERCSGLTSISLSNGLTAISYGCFMGCSVLKTITIPYGVTSIDTYAFEGCCSLTSVSIPSSVAYIGFNAFADCTGLTSVHITDLEAWCKIKLYHEFANPLFFAHHLYLNGEEIKNLVIPKTVTEIGPYAFCGCSGLTSLVIHENIWDIGRSITGIGNPFSGCSGLTSITVENSNRYDSRDNCNAIIQSNTLIAGCKTTVIPNSVTSIADNAFRDISSLTSLTIPNSVKTIGKLAFYGCSGLKAINIGNGVTDIGDYAFLYCGDLSSVTIGNSVMSIGESAFWGCYGLTEVHISDLEAWCKITYDIESNPLYYAHHLFLNDEEIKDLVIPDGITSIGNYAFYGCSGLTSVTIPHSVSTIDYSAFRGCDGISSLNIPNSVTSIGGYAFGDCSSLATVKIPNSVTSIGEGAFNGCWELNNIISDIQNPFEISKYVFSTYYRATLTVPYGTRSAYMSTNYWNNFDDIVEASGSSWQNEANSISSVNEELGMFMEKWYTLDGHQLQGKPKQKGTYIHNGKVVIIK